MYIYIYTHRYAGVFYWYVSYVQNETLIYVIRLLYTYICIYVYIYTFTEVFLLVNLLCTKRYFYICNTTLIYVNVYIHICIYTGIEVSFIGQSCMNKTRLSFVMYMNESCLAYDSVSVFFCKSHLYKNRLVYAYAAGAGRIHVCASLCICVHIYVYMYMYTYMCICVYMCTHMYKNIWEWPPDRVCGSAQLPGGWR